MRLTIIESPFAANATQSADQHLDYLRECIRDSLRSGEAPIASHAIYTQPGILRDDIPAERAWGISAGLAWYRVADLIAFYTDRGWSNGMRAALEVAKRDGRNYIFRAISGRIIEP